MTRLLVNGVTKHFGDTVAVDDVSFALGDHELLALVGPSGCGKSTLLRLVAGLLSTEVGSVELGGIVVDDGRTVVPPERRRVGLVFQEHALFPHLTVAANIGFGVRSGGRVERVAEMLDLVGLTGYGARYPHELSGGERQRVALARALAPRPSLLMLDEPFASLDPGLRTRIRDDVAAILRSTGTPAVFVTHDQNEALAIGDRIAVMRSGRIVQIASPEAVFHTPVSRFVGAFMGDADFVDSPDALRDLDGVRAADLDGCHAARWVMLRPDDVTFTVDDRGSAVVTAAEFRGSTWCYTLRLVSGAVLRSMRSHLDHVPVGTTVAPALVPGHRPVPVPADADR